jgi:hypothetical protein
MLVLFPFFLGLFAQAQEPEKEVPEEVPAEVPEEVPEIDLMSQAFESALEDYFAGRLESARAGLLRLIRQPELRTHALRFDAYVYLAEMEYYLGERDASWTTCVELLSQEPDYKIDPFVHPPELVAFFESVRSASAQLQPKPKPKPKPLTRSVVPAWAVLLPGGIQVHKEQEILGYLSMGVIGALGATSTGLYLALRHYDLDRNRPGIQVSTPGDQAQADLLLRWTNATRWTVAGLWSASLIHGLFTSTGEPRGTRVSLQPGGLGLHWDWP